MRPSGCSIALCVNLVPPRWLTYVMGAVRGMDMSQTGACSTALPTQPIQITLNKKDKKDGERDRHFSISGLIWESCGGGWEWGWMGVVGAL